MYKAIIIYNRFISKKLVSWLSSVFGSIDAAEDSFYLNVRSRKYSCVIEIGGADRPLFSIKELEHYVGIDVDNSFKWQNVYSEYYCQSCENMFVPKVKADLVVSKYVLEHIRDNVLVFANIKLWLAPGGVSVHLLPLGYHPFSLLNKLFGNRIAKVLIPVFRPGTEVLTGYKAYYNQCNSIQLEKELSKLGLRYNIEYFFGAEDYFGFFFPLALIVHFFNRLAAFFGFNILASNAVVVIHA
jgi:hypothetical protein